MIGEKWYWIAQIVPRKLVHTCVLRAVNHAMTNKGIKSVTAINAGEVMIEWRDLIHGESKEKRQL